MENLIFSLNATVPVFLMMILGLVFKKIGWIDDIFASKMNKFVFMGFPPAIKKRKRFFDSFYCNVYSCCYDY